MSLQSFIDQKNIFRKLLGEKEFSLHSLKQEDVDWLAGAIDSAMSPENLHCDGEISYAAAMRKARELRAVFNELKEYVAKRNLTMPQTWEIS